VQLGATKSDDTWPWRAMGIALLSGALLSNKDSFYVSCFASPLNVEHGALTTLSKVELADAHMTIFVM
jgi:hypothetical protein